MTEINILSGKKGDEVKMGDKIIIIQNSYNLITDGDSGNKYYEIETNNKIKFKINESYLLKIINVKIDNIDYYPLWFYKNKRIFANIQTNNNNYNINIVNYLFDKLNNTKFRYTIKSVDEYDYRIENIKVYTPSLKNTEDRFSKMNSPPVFYKEDKIRIIQNFEGHAIVNGPHSGKYNNNYRLIEIINETDESKKRYYEMFVGVYDPQNIENTNTNTKFSFIVDEVSLPKILQLNINNVSINTPSWLLATNQYICCRLPNNKLIYLHRYLSGCINGDNKTIDHINNNKLDNRLSNLKVATMTEQNMNRPNVNRKHDLNSILNPIQIIPETPETQLSIPKIATKSLLFITKKKSDGVDYFCVEISKARTRVKDIRDNSSKSSLLTLKEKLGHVIYKRYIYICKYPIIMKEQIDGKTFTTLDEFKIHSEVKLNEILTTEQPNTIIYTLDSFLDYLNTKKIPKYIDPRIKDRLNTNITIVQATTVQATTVQPTTNTSEPILLIYNNTYTYKSDDKFTFIDNGKNSRDITIKISNNIKDNIRFSGSGSKKLTNEEKLCHTLMNRYFILIIHENNINLEIHKDNLTTINNNNNNNIVNKNTTGKKTLSDLIIDGYKFTHFDEFKKHTEKIIKDIMISIIPDNLFTIDTINTYFINKINDKRYNKPIPLLTNNYPILTT